MCVGASTVDDGGSGVTTGGWAQASCRAEVGGVAGGQLAKECAADVIDGGGETSKSAAAAPAP